MKLKSALWQQLLEDLHVLKQQIEESDTASKEANAAGNSDVMKLVLALENLDVDEKVYHGYLCSHHYLIFIRGNALLVFGRRHRR